MKRTGRIRWVRLVLAGLASIGVAGCSPDGDEMEGRSATSDRPVIATSFYPTAYWVERIAGDAVQIARPRPADADPAHWTPAPAAIAVFQQADLVVLNGAGFEQWAETAPLPRSRLVFTARAIGPADLIRTEGVVHSHGPGGAHSHAETDGFTWVDPVLARTQARVVLDALVRLLPDRAAAMNDAFDALAADLDQIDQRLRALSEQVGDRPMVMSHPSYRYLGRRYGWTLVDADLDPEAESNDVPNDLESVFGPLERPIVLWELVPTESFRAYLTDTFGASHVVFTPGESIETVRQTGATDYIDAMRQNLDRFEAMLDEG